MHSATVALRCADFATNRTHSPAMPERSFPPLRTSPTRRHPPVPSASTSTAYSPSETHTHLKSYPATRYGSETSPFLTSSRFHTIALPMAGPRRSSAPGSTKRRLEWLFAGPFSTPFALRLFMNSFIAESSQPSTTLPFHSQKSPTTFR